VSAWVSEWMNSNTIASNTSPCNRRQSRPPFSCDVCVCVCVCVGLQNRQKNQWKNEPLFTLTPLHHQQRRNQRLRAHSDREALGGGRPMSEPPEQQLTLRISLPNSELLTLSVPRYAIRDPMLRCVSSFLTSASVGLFVLFIELRDRRC
jgi:hypothetical protein